MKQIVTWVLGLALLSGCGYSTGSLKGPAEGRSVWVPIVANSSHRREVEKPLTDAVMKEIQAAHGLRLARSRQEADSELVITLEDVEEHTSLENRLNVVTQQTVLFQVRLTWTDLRTGEPIPLLSQVAADSRSFTVTRSETFATAAAEVAEKLAEKVVEAMDRPMD